MQDFRAATLFELCKEIGRIVQASSGGDLATEIIASVGSANQKLMTGHANTFGWLSLPMCKAQCERMAERSGAGKLTFGEWRAMLDELYHRMGDETDLIKVISLTPQESDLYSPKQPLFGLDVPAKFPSATYEVDEAAKCLALGRSTSCVFHLMRVMEIGIQALSRSLQIPDPVKPAERNWGVILEKVWDDGIAQKWPKAADRAHGDGHYFEGLFASLDAVKNPWRNATMHVENKYTPEEAEHIFSAVRGFMRRLAARVDENGEPKA